MDILIWVLFVSSLAFLITGIWFWFAGRKEWKKEENMASVVQTLLKEAKLYNDEANKALIDAAIMLDDAKKHLETGRKLVEKRNELNDKSNDYNQCIQSGGSDYQST